MPLTIFTGGASDGTSPIISTRTQKRRAIPWHFLPVHRPPLDSKSLEMDEYASAIKCHPPISAVGVGSR
ncbi:hypothetical protein OUZ56_027897 [Daphnia magna]|uniref:Uncharacterized protein n=1 Tax=Daphnia magna TaxID=35525 RepID=A0ABR0B292_9CRUS|nr:hypothetical protein OUZ56_027897 [Daphnia magna]